VDTVERIMVELLPLGRRDDIKERRSKRLYVGT
jgi:hypothetical protein